MKSVAAENIKEKALQWTPQRKTVFSVIANSEKKHLLAEEIYLMSKKVMPNIGLATIYRTLELFCTEGILQKINLPGEPARFEMLKEGNNDHCHYVCLGCGKIFEAPIQKDLSLSGAENDNIKDFTITTRSCWYFGYCKNCRDKAKIK
ncbi:MAG: Fur family transcriptional regulator, ferric uptake regulator [Thermoanaerobacteraceae bacterium]|jgi:Fur family ferric uptake transcriptional regulator|nr:Fur family transcriptional regulator, ferric uptake regulator [Thermoanaerobacteraceae bacterium]